MNSKSKIGVALSGGVDSALAARLLQEQGYEVFGLHMNLGLADQDGTASARAVAGRLEIELQVVDVRAAFEQEVKAPFLDLYEQGLTPNPCAICNREVKFTQLMAACERLGGHGLATGHYVRLDKTQDPPALIRGADPRKEQSYFLARLKPQWLDRLHFPLGELTKEEVRVMAGQRGIPSADRPESQEACFLEGGDYRAYYEARRTVRPGPVVDPEGRVIGRHKGLYAYTVGQRRGLGIPAKRPYYVHRLDGVNNTLVVGPKEGLFKDEALVRAVTWLVDPQDYLDRPVRIQVRYRAEPLPCKLELERDNLVRVRLERPQKAVAPGQLAVFYSGNRVLGGGWLA